MVSDDPKDGYSASSPPSEREIIQAHQQALDLASRAQHAAACEKFRHLFLLLERLPAWASLPHLRFFYAMAKSNMANSLIALGDIDRAVSAFDEAFRLVDFSREVERQIAPYVAAQVGPNLPDDVAALLQARPEESVAAFLANVYHNRGFALESARRFEAAAIDYGRAITIYERLLALGGRGVVVRLDGSLFRRARCRMQSGLLQQAQGDLERGTTLLLEEIHRGALDLVPGLLETVNGFVSILISQGMTAQAVPWLNRTARCVLQAVSAGLKSQALSGHLGALIQSIAPHLPRLHEAGLDWTSFETAGEALGVLRPVETVSTHRSASGIAGERNAMALYDRAARKHQAGDAPGAIHDLSAIIDMPDAPSRLKAIALSTRGRIRRAHGNHAEAIQDHTTLLRMPGVPAQLKAEAFVNRGMASAESGDVSAAVRDFTAALQVPEASPAIKAEALNRRAAMKLPGDVSGAIHDYTTLLGLDRAPPAMRAWALYNRGCLRRDTGDTPGALRDFSTLIDMPDAPAERKATALYNRGCIRARDGDFEAALVDFRAVIAMADAPADLRDSAAADLRQVEHDAGLLTGDASWKTTPYDDYEYPPRTGPARPSKDFDFFISYKSEDISIARRVADSLIADGFRVWLAEYTILMTARDRFQEAIDDGIRRSKYGIVFTNDRYARSPYCRLELEQLLQRDNCGAERTIQIRLRDEPATHEQYPALADSPSVLFSGRVADVLHVVKHVTHRNVTIPADEDSAPSYLYRDEELGYTLDIGGWEESLKIGGSSMFGKSGPSCQKIIGGNRVSWNLIVGPFVPGTRRLEIQSGALDDRKAYEFTLECVASPFMGFPMVDATPRGVHLFHIGGYSQVGLTYWFQGSSPSYWTRRYSIVLPHSSNPQVPIEFAFTVAFFGPFREYCRCVHEIDRIVESLSW